MACTVKVLVPVAGKVTATGLPILRCWLVATWVDTAIPEAVMLASWPWVTPMLNRVSALTGSVATTAVVLPSICTTPERIPATAPTCGSALSDGSRLGLKPLEPPAAAPLLITKSARTAEPMIELTEALVDEAMMLISDTRVTPTIRAAAVAAVRDGLRIAFCCPSLPAVLRMASGAPITWLTLRATNGPSTAMPTNTATAPPPTSGTRFPACPNNPAASTAAPPTTRIAPQAARRTEGWRGSAATSCMAVTGGIRAARRAGEMADPQRARQLFQPGPIGLLTTQGKRENDVLP